MLKNNRPEIDKLRNAIRYGGLKKAKKVELSRKLEQLEKTERERSAAQAKARAKALAEHKAKQEKIKEQKAKARKELAEKQKARKNERLAKAKTKNQKDKIRLQEKEKSSKERAKLAEKFKPIKESSDKYKDLRQNAARKLSKYKKAGLVDESFQLPTKSEYSKLTPTQKSEITRQVKKIANFKAPLDYVAKTKEQMEKFEQEAEKEALTTNKTKQEIYNKLSKQLDKDVEDLLRLSGIKNTSGFKAVNKSRKEKEYAKGSAEDTQLLVRSINSIFASFNTRYADNLLDILEMVRTQKGAQGVNSFSSLVLDNFDSIFGQDSIVYDSDGLGASKGYILARDKMMRMATDYIAANDSEKEDIYKKLEDQIDEGQDWQVETYKL